MAGGKKRSKSKAGCSNKKKQRRDDEKIAAAAEEEEKQPLFAPPPLVIPPSPIVRLYQDALQSVFKFLNLRELSRVMRTSRSWHAAVVQMPSAGFSVTCKPVRFRRLCSSVLSKHVSGLSGTAELRFKAVSTLALSMPQLTSLNCSVFPSLPNEVIRLPHRLQTLDLNLGKHTAAGINAIIKGVCPLKAMTKLKLTFQAVTPAINFEPLAAVESLQHLHLDVTSSVSELSDAQVEQLRALPRLHWMAVENLSSLSLSRLLRTPHDLQWQQIQSVTTVDAVASAALSGLPTLHSLFTESCEDIGFLTHLVQLRALDLNTLDWPETVTADAVVGGLSCCTQLTDLTLAAPLNGHHLSVLLPRLPRLTALRLLFMDELESLECLSSDPIVHQLRSLQLTCCQNLDSVELLHVHRLKVLESLSISQSFLDPLGNLEIHLFTPPSILIPTLKKFEYEPPDIDWW